MNDLVARLLLVVVLIASGACSTGGDKDASRDAGGEVTSPPQDGVGPIREFAIEISELSGSGVTGRADMESVGSESAKVVIELKGAPDGPLAVHTHAGPCRGQPSEATHTLEPVVDGRSESEILASVQGLTHGFFGVSIHENEEANSKHIACGLIGGAPSDE